MISKVFNVFGKNILFKLDESPEANILIEELDCYEEIKSIHHFDLIIRYKLDQNISEDIIANNPSIHALHNDGFSMKTYSITTRFIFDKFSLKKIIFSYNKKISVLRNFIKKWKDIQFLNEREAIGQTVHELLLIPINFFVPNRAIIHSSAVVSKKGHLLMFGGTGGVGKTSLELELCRNHECAFFADDICVSDNSGLIYPNLSYPKIYGYNLINNNKLKGELIKKNNLTDKLHWKLHSLKGLDKVRRRIKPSLLYKIVTNYSHKLKSFFILNRTDVKQLVIEEIDNEFASLLNTEVIKSEYQIIFQHLFWLRYNTLLKNREEIITFENIMNQNAKVFSDCLNRAGAKSYVINIPFLLTNEELKKQIGNLLYELDLV